VSSIEDLLTAAHDPAYRRVQTATVVVVKQSLRDEHAELEALLSTLTSDTIDAPEGLVETAERLAEIEAEFEASKWTFKLAAIGQRAWADLLRAHPPTPAQKKADRGAEFDDPAFPYAAIAASTALVLKPGDDAPDTLPDAGTVWTAEQVAEFHQSPLCDVKAWSDLWQACITANVVASAPKSLAASILRSSGAFAKQPTTT
jgi:hypothetical protein